MDELLPPRLLARLESLQLVTRRRLAGRFSGEHRSRAYGASTDFADYREYHPGDDFRRIDYALYARLDVLLIRLFEAEDDAHVRLVLDTSGSMAVEGKLDHARRLAAALGFVALVRRDPVTVHTFPLDRPSPRFAGQGAVPGLFAHLSSLRPSGATRFADAATHLLTRRGPPGLTVVLSDLLADDWEAGLRRLPAGRGDVVLAHVLAPGDLRPAAVGDVEVVDSETGRRVAVTLTDAEVAAFARRADTWTRDVASRCAHGGVGYVRTVVGDDLESLLLGGLREAGVLR